MDDTGAFIGGVGADGADGDGGDSGTDGDGDGEADDDVDAADRRHAATSPSSTTATAAATRVACLRATRRSKVPLSTVNTSSTQLLPAITSVWHALQWVRESRAPRVSCFAPEAWHWQPV